MSVLDINHNEMKNTNVINKNIFRNKKRTRLLLYNKNIKNKAGRSNNGRITVFSKGKKGKQLYRLVDYKRSNHNVPGKIYTKEYDPKRSSFISLVLYKNNICCYIIGVNNTIIGSNICSYNRVVKDHLSYNKGDSNRIMYFNTGSIIHNVEYYPGKGGVFIRSAGTFGKIIKKHSNIKKVLVRLPSKSTFYTSLYSFATLGVVSNINHHKRIIGKAGRNRWLGIKPNVRGVAMNPVDHPHGGGEGKKSNPSFKRSPWGKINKWVNKNRLFY